MSQRLRLVLTVHNHQPVGNFDGVFEDSYQKSYLPFLETLEQNSFLRVGLHNSGSLLEWIEKAHPEYIERVRALAATGQVEILGGPFYEPILACIPRRDRVGQMTLYKTHLEKLFDTTVRGMWVPERVWEQSFAADVADAGLEYTVLDDSHFRYAGVPEDGLFGYYLTEESGRMIKVFPICEQLRYTIPFAPPEATFSFLEDLHRKHPGYVATFGDDGEKFGVWPGTYELIYTNGWLEKFLNLLQANADWLEMITPAEAIDTVSPMGKRYLPDASYREMTEWALPTEMQQLYEQVVIPRHDDPDWPQLKQFVRAGFWRNFLVKYPESNEMYCRMLQVSRRIEDLSSDGKPFVDPQAFEAARTDLYRAQCNCPYWHGAFGGLYLPHLRNAIYSCLISAENLLDRAEGRQAVALTLDAADYDMDARQEVRLTTDKLIGFFAPARGGHLYELDVRTIRHNLLATLNRRPEAYHERILKAAEGNGDDGGHVASIDGELRLKQPDLHEKLGYDSWMRKSLIDHFLATDLAAEDFWRGHGLTSDFTNGVYQSKLRRSTQRVELQMSREGNVNGHPVQVVKKVSVEIDSPNQLDVVYVLTGLPVGESLHFGVEWNFAGMPAGQSDRYFYGGNGSQIGPLELMLDLENQERIGLIDEWLGIDVSLEFSRPAAIWSFPIQTVSQSEGGFELVHQSTAVLPHWYFTVPEDGRWEVGMSLNVDTSAAAARQLAALGPSAREPIAVNPATVAE